MGFETEASQPAVMSAIVITKSDRNERSPNEWRNGNWWTDGVPQGSILGQALFSICINDLPTIPHFSSLESYVDDSKLYLSFPVRDVNTIVQQINEDLSLIASWCCRNHLLINPDKTKLLVMGTRQMLQKLPDFHITLLGKEIGPSASARDLGVQVDATLSYNEHVTNITSTCMASLCQINRIKHRLDSRTLDNVITSLVFSKLYFCSTVWANTSKTRRVAWSFFQVRTSTYDLET